MKLTKVLSIAAIACLGLVSTAAAEIKLSKAQMEEATEVYFDRCAGCHGMLRKGALGPSLEPEKK